MNDAEQEYAAAITEFDQSCKRVLAALGELGAYQYPVRLKALRWVIAELKQHLIEEGEKRHAAAEQVDSVPAVVEGSRPADDEVGEMGSAGDAWDGPEF